MRAERRFSAGLIDAHPPSTDWSGRIARFVGRVGRATGAQPQVQRDAAEPLLLRLEKGELDVVIGPMAPTSPWEKQVSLLPALAEHVGPDRHLRLAAIARNGENEWIELPHGEALAERAAR